MSVSRSELAAWLRSRQSVDWLMMLDPSTSEVRPVYVEPEIVVSPFRLH